VKHRLILRLTQTMHWIESRPVSEEMGVADECQHEGCKQSRSNMVAHEAQSFCDV